MKNYDLLCKEVMKSSVINPLNLNSWYMKRGYIPGWSVYWLVMDRVEDLYLSWFKELKETSSFAQSSTFDVVTFLGQYIKFFAIC